MFGLLKVIIVGSGKRMDVPCFVLMAVTLVINMSVDHAP